MISLVGCNANNQSEKNNNSNVQVENNGTKEEVKEEVKTVSIGETISTESAEILINNVELTNEVWPDETDETDEEYTFYYPAESGKVYINVDVDVKNMQKRDLECDNIMNVKASYNDGYRYNAKPVLVEDSTTGLNDSYTMSIAPLETKGMRYLISYPKEVEESQNSLVLTFELDGEKYSYAIR